MLVEKFKPKRARPNDDAERAFEFQCKALRLPPIQAQHKFALELNRQWRADFAFTEYKLLVEVDGGIWIGGAHGHPKDILRNMEKQNDATLLGWRILRFTPAQVKDGSAIAFTQRVLVRRGWKIYTRGGDCNGEEKTQG